MENVSVLKELYHYSPNPLKNTIKKKLHGLNNQATLTDLDQYLDSDLENETKNLIENDKVPHILDDVTPQDIIKRRESINNQLK